MIAGYIAQRGGITIVEARKKIWMLDSKVGWCESIPSETS
jgi:hypothetical protein